MQDGFMFTIVENTMGNREYTEKSDFAGSEGLTQLGADPGELSYELNVP